MLSLIIVVQLFYNIQKLLAVFPLLFIAVGCLYNYNVLNKYFEDILQIMIKNPRADLPSFESFTST